ncbi:MAG: hypothetical protein N2712_00665 [Brevinematales bacterium]|nr:hypothetical protein [Brevinematales bacterium]
MEGKVLARKILRKLSILISLFLFSYAAFSDVLILKNNEVFKGKLLSKKGGVVSFKTYDGRILNFSEGNIAVIEFISEKVVEVQMDGRSIKGVEVGRTKDGVIVRTVLGETVVESFKVKELSKESLSLFIVTNYFTNYYTNYYSLTNEVSVVVTNFVYVTNYTSVSDTNIYYSNNNFRISFYVGSSYDFLNYYFDYGIDFSIKFYEKFGVGVVITKLGLGVAGTYNFLYYFSDWFGARVGLGGYFSVVSSYAVVIGISSRTLIRDFEFSVPIELYVIDNKTVLSIRLSMVF